MVVPGSWMSIRSAASRPMRKSPQYAGSSEIMKLIIGRHCLEDHYDPFNQRNFKGVEMGALTGYKVIELAGIGPAPMGA